MSLAFRTNPGTSFMYSSLHNGGVYSPRTFCQENFGFFYQNEFFQPSVLRFKANMKLGILKSAQSLIHRLCKRRVAFSSVAPSAASTFNNSVNDFEECGGREGIHQKESANGDELDTNGYGHGNSDSRGGGANNGSGSGGLDENADWEGVRWFCWRFFQTYYNSFVVALSRVGDILDNTERWLKKMAEPNLEGILLVLLEPIILRLRRLLVLPCLLLSVAFCMGFFAEVLMLGCVFALALICFWRF